MRFFFSIARDVFRNRCARIGIDFGSVNLIREIDSSNENNLQAFERTLRHLGGVWLVGMERNGKEWNSFHMFGWLKFNGMGIPLEW